MKKRQIVIVMEGKQYPLDKPPQDLKAFKERVYGIDRVLRWRAWYPQAQLEQSLDIRTAQIYADYIQNHGAKDFIVHIIMERPYPPIEPFRQYSGAIAMLLDKEQNVIGNAILITKKHVLVSDSLVARREDLGSFSVYFQLEKDVVVPLRREGLFMHAKDLEVVIVELDLGGQETRPVQELNPVYVKDVKQVPRNEQMDYLYVSVTVERHQLPSLAAAPQCEDSGERPTLLYCGQGPGTRYRRTSLL